MEGRGSVSPREDDQHSTGYFAKLGAALRSLSRGPVGESPEATPSEPQGEKAVSLSHTRLDCPECGSAAIVRDKGVSMTGVGFCGHEYVYKMVKIICASGHKLDAMDELGSVHGPEGLPCEGVNIGGS